MQISAQFKKIAVLIDKNGFISPLEQMTASFPFDVDVGGIRAVEVVHDLAKITVWGLDNQVIMIRHEDICVKQETEFCLCFGNVFLKFLIVLFCKNILLRSLPRAVTWYIASSYSIRSGLAITFLRLFYG